MIPSKLWLAVVVVLLQRTIAVGFPPIVDADDIAFFFGNDNLEDLHWALEGTFNLSHRVLGDQGPRELLQSQTSRGSGSHYTTSYKLTLDLEQAQHIAAGGEDGDVPDHVRRYFQSTVVPTFDAVLKRIPPLDQLASTGGLYAFDVQDYAAGIREVYNRALFVPASPPLPRQMTYFGRGGLDVAGIEARWRAASPRIVVVDDLLSKLALQKVRKVLTESTVWYQTKMPEKFGGYVGAYIDDGLHQKLLLALASELRRLLPGIFQGHDLRYMWAYKYFPGFNGIKVRPHVVHAVVCASDDFNSSSPRLSR
jgi:hypothetical protein